MGINGFCQLTKFNFRDYLLWLVYFGNEMPSDASESAVKALVIRLGEVRRAAGLTLEQVAERSGVDLGVISRSERGQRIPALASLLDLSKALRVDFPELLAEVLPPDFRNSGNQGASGSRVPGK